MREIVYGDVDMKSFHVLIFSLLVLAMDARFAWRKFRGARLFMRRDAGGDHFAAPESPNFCNSASRISSVIG